MKKLIMLCLLIFLVACSKQDNHSNDVQPNPNTEETPNEEVPSEVTINYKDYFMPNDTIAYFEGMGNEFASYYLLTIWLDDHYVVTIVDNGGATVQRIYRLTDQEVVLIDEEVMDMPPENAVYPSIEELHTMAIKEVYLKGPFEKGASFGKWTIVETNATLETPYKQFDDVIVFEETGDNFINRHYFVKGFGEVKREAIMNVEGVDENPEQFIVTSTLKSIEYKE